MKLIEKIADLREEIKRFKREGKIIGFVPTMGYFHEGHLSLMDIARKRSDVLVVSIFVNPIQFGPNEDYNRYPRDLKRDLKLAEERGVDIVFHPDNREMYQENFQTYVNVEKLTKGMCGKYRPGHFRGVTTVVAKLFNIVQPDIAVFGQKDVQQAIVIKRMVGDLNFPVEIVVGPVIREHDGLAMSSRNTYLNDEERKQAPMIYKALKVAREKVKMGNRDAAKLKEIIESTIATAPLARIEYVEIVDDENLEPVSEVKPGTLAAVAVWFGKTRLIDNIYLMER
ncbi:MAG: pantoate--beta-alanine ligase [Candidatus Neomarinimicrobiota bacterium]|nr:MAG: pantoate--beta-alanine ligase [Candidatus Neomarinimicrobiota bacterium]